MPNAFDHRPESWDHLSTDHTLPIEELVKQVKAEDEIRDHSFSALSKEEKLELEIFKTMKRDPYFVHYVNNNI